MEIYLIRHTTPAIEKGTCYGQTDLDTTESFLEEAAKIKSYLPGTIKKVYSSPLKRCRMLAEHLFPQKEILFDDRLKEINCGEWEMQFWDQIERPHLDRWMADMINVCIPGGESYFQLYQRVSRFFEEVITPDAPIAMVAHGGVIRSILSHINKVDLKESFATFSTRYGCVVKITRTDEKLAHTFLYNPFFEKEQHKPSFY